MPATDLYGYRYPGPTDVPDMGYWNAQLANDVEDRQQALDVWGSVAQGNYSKTTPLSTGLVMVLANRSPNTGGVVIEIDGFTLPAGNWEIDYSINWGPQTGGSTWEMEAWMSNNTVEIPFTHSWSGSGGGRAANQQGKAFLVVAGTVSRIRLAFGSATAGQTPFIPPNGARMSYRRLS